MRRPLLLLALMLASASMPGCASKRKEASQEPEVEAPPSPADFAPPEEENPEPTPVAAADPYAGMSEDERLETAKKLFAEGEKLAKAGDWENAELKYEQAYYLVPGKHGFAFKVGEAAHKAGHCPKAEQYLTHFQTYGDPKKHAKELATSKKILAATAGCGG